MSSELQCWAKSRPLRVAFLVQDGEHAALALDGIFADCYARWGGRFSLIVPCREGKIPTAYWPWLEAFDPDVVFSYVSLGRDDLLEVHERLGPSEYMMHHSARGEPRLDVHGFKPDYKFKPLSSLSTIFRQARYSGGLRLSVPVKVLDVWHTDEPSRFFSDNFGTYLASTGTGLVPSDAASVLSLRAVVTDEHWSGPYGVPKDLDRIADELSAFSEFATGKATSLSLASILFAPKLDLHDHRWSGSFNLVVGSTFEDRILHWNARLLIPSWLDTDLHCLRVDPEQVEDPQFFTSLVSLINTRNHVNGGSGGQPQLTLRSRSLSPPELEALRDTLRAAKVWSHIGVEVVDSLDELAPDHHVLENAKHSGAFGGVHPPVNWMRLVWTPPTIRPPAFPPEHIADAPPRQHFTEGYWCTEFIIEDGAHGLRYANGNRWKLPRRWRMATQFGVTQSNKPMHQLGLSARSTRQGNLAVFTTAQTTIESITVPSPQTAFSHALTAEHGWLKDDLERGRINLEPKIGWAEPSNEARYLNGVLGLVGGLGDASAFLLHPFLRRIFAAFGGTPNLPRAKVEPTVNFLTKRAQMQATFDLSDPREKITLANLVVKAGASLKSPQAFFAYGKLKADWEAHRAAYWAANPKTHAPDPRVDQMEVDSLDDCLIGLRRRQMLFQGHRWTCAECHHKNWLDLGAVTPEMTCGVCKTISQAPVNIEWLFRPNAFLIESLRDHSVLSLVWVLRTFQDQARESFMYEGPVQFGFSRDAWESGADAEADLLAVVDGRTYLCEVKSSWASTRRSDIEKLVELAKRLRPDVAMLAVMEDKKELEDAILAAKQALEPVGVQFKLMTWREAHQMDDVYLPS